MSSVDAAPRAAVPLSPARAEASRRNGAMSRGPKTPEGKAHSAQNALKHGLRAQKHVVLPGESATEFAALETALLEELVPEGALQSVLAQRVVAAAWRLSRAERLEVELFAHHLRGERNLGLALIRDGNGARAFDTLLRYRGGTLAELWRALRTLKALQAEATLCEAPAPPPEPPAHAGALEQEPIEPEARTIPREIAPAASVQEPVADHSSRPGAARAASDPDVQPEPYDHPTGYPEAPKEPEGRRNPGETASLPASGPTRGSPARAAGLRGPAFGATFAAGRDDAEGSRAGSPDPGRSGR
jgi:hypothetical protein